jgi:rhamnose transport system permease protein
VFRVPSIVATLGTLSIFRGIDYLIAGSHQVPLAGCRRASPTRPATRPRHPDLRLSWRRRRHRVGRPALDAVRAAGLRRRQQPEAAAILGIPSRLVVFVAFALCGLLAGIAGVMYVIQFGTINGTSAGGYTLQVVAAVVVGGVGIFGGTGTLAGAALGALFLGFIANALILVGLSQFWLQAIYGLVILVAVSADAAILRRLQRAASLNRSR